MQPSSNPPQAAHRAMRKLRRAQAALAALATGPCGTETVTIVQAMGRVLAVQPASAAAMRGLPDDVMPLRVGTVLSPTHTALLASRRLATLNVFARVRVGLACVAAGSDECRTMEAMLGGLVNRIGAKALSTRCPSPDPGMVPRMVEMLLAGCDLVLLCGDMSGPDWSGLVRALGAHDADMSSLVVPPLDPVRIAQHGGKLVVQFGSDLGSAFATFVMLLSPLVRRLQGRADPIPASIPFPACAEFGGHDGEPLVLTRVDAGGAIVPFPALGTGSSDARLLALARATDLAWVVDDGADDAPPTVTYFPLDAWLS
jgi:molybdopterin molybdotransferase